MADAAATDSELELHYKAYLQIFQAVLRKLPLEDAARKQRLQKVNSYLRAEVHDTKDFVAHLPQFAKALGVKEPALGTFVGANFLKALQMAKKAAEAAEADEDGAAGAAQPGPSARRYGSFLEELVDQMGDLVSGGHFVPMDDGLLKFVSPAGEVLPASLGPSNDTAAPPATAGANGAGEQSATTVTGKPAASESGQATKPAGQAKAKSAPGRPEKSIIQEILETFGSVLDVPGKLEPSSGLEEAAPSGTAAPAEGDSIGDPADPAEPDAHEPGPVRSARPQQKPESPIIAEILEKFGSQLDVHEKLVPSTGLEGQEEYDQRPTSEDGAEDDSGDPGTDAATSTDFEPLPFDFEGYMATLRKVQEFQAAGREQDYRAWLHSAPATQKALVALRNLDTRARSAEVVWEDEYYTLTHHLGPDVSIPQLEELHRRIRGYGRIHQLIGKVKAALRGKPAPLVAAMKRVWPNILLLLNMHTDTDGYEADFQITLLQIPDANLRTHVQKFMRPVFAKLAEIYAGME